MTTDNYHSHARTQLLALGYEPIPCHNKIPSLKGWNAADYAALGLAAVAARQTWPTTGVRVKEFRVLDMDVDHEIVDDIHAAIRTIAPEVWERAPTRFGKSNFKCAMFCGLPPGDEPLGIVASRRWFAGSESEYKAAVAAKGKIETHRFEIFGGAPTKQGKVAKHAGCYGLHSPGVDYVWDDTRKALHEVAPAALPMLTAAQAREILDAVDAICKQAGWHAVEPQLEGPAKDHFDIYRADTRFDLSSGENVSYDELCALFTSRGELRVRTTFLPDRHGDRGDHGQVHYSKKYGCHGIHVHGDAANHYPVTHKPRLEKILDIRAAVTAAAKKRPAADSPPPEPKRTAERAPAAATKKTPAGASPPPEPDIDMAERVGWLLQTYGYAAGDDRVVRLHDTDMTQCRLKPEAFGRLYAAWKIDAHKGPPIWATSLWLQHDQRLSLAGIRMRPDRPFPTYEEDGKTYKNVYRRPVHPAGGELQPFLDFMQRFLPDDFQRGYMLDWLAHKWLHPEVPSIALIFVAEQAIAAREESFGTGRGLLANAAHRLYGPQYSRPQMFSVLDGTSGQSAYTDWLHGSILVTIDEGKSSPTSYRRGERSATYEILKNIVDPAPKAHRFTVKYGAAFEGMSYCSIWLATNHANAIAIPAHDRRFAVLRNGRPMTPQEAEAFVAWLEVPANIGALSAFLATRDLSGFNAYVAPQTDAKGAMAAHAISEVDEIMAELREDPSRGLVFSRKQMADVVGRSASTPHWHGNFQDTWARYCVAVRTTAGHHRRVRIGDMRAKLFCFVGKEAEAAALPEPALGRSAKTWGPGVVDEDSATGIRVLAGLGPAPGATVGAQEPGGPRTRGPRPRPKKPSGPSKTPSDTET